MSKQIMQGVTRKLRLKSLILLLLPTVLQAQITYTANKTTTLSGSAEVITVQQPASSANNVQFVSAYLDCSVSCTGTIERNGTAASSTTLATTQANPDQVASVATAWSASNVGTGTVISRFSLAAGGSIVIDLSRVYMQGNGTGKNLTVRTSSITGTVDIIITWTEKGQ